VQRQIRITEQGEGDCPQNNSQAERWVGETLRFLPPPPWSNIGSIKSFPYLDPLNHVQIELLKRHPGRQIPTERAVCRQSS